MQRFPVTVEGERLLREELTERKQVHRARITRAIAVAREHGDLKENAEYHAAREEQSFNEGRIREIEAKLSSAQVIDITRIPNSNKVIFGCTVTIVNCADDSQLTYKIVGEDEASIADGKLSFSSPIAKGLITKEVGDEVEIKTPGGNVHYEITQVEHI